MSRTSLVSLFFTMLVMMPPGTLRAQDPLVRPQEVTVGVYLNQVTDFSLGGESVTVDFYLWFRWDPTQPAPDGPPPHERFEIVGAADVTRETITARDGYVCLRVRATIKEPWDVSDFPMDNHTLRVRIEDAAFETHLVSLVPDTVNTAIGPNVWVAGWAVGQPRLISSTSDYASNFGDLDLPTGSTSSYGRITLEVPLDRNGMGTLWKLVSGLTIAVCVCLVSFWIPAVDVDPRFGLSVGSLFATVASQYVVASTLPATATWTLSDKLHLVGLVVILVAIGQSAISLHYLKRGDHGGARIAQRLDRGFFAVLLPAWLGCSALLITNT